MAGRAAPFAHLLSSLASAHERVLRENDDLRARLVELEQASATGGVDFKGPSPSPPVPPVLPLLEDHASSSPPTPRSASSAHGSLVLTRGEVSAAKLSHVGILEDGDGPQQLASGLGSDVATDSTGAFALRKAVRLHTNHFVHRAHQFLHPEDLARLRHANNIDDLTRRLKVEQFRHICRTVAHNSTWFNVIICITIIANGVQVAMETQLSLQGSIDAFHFDVAESVCLVIFIIELLIRYGADGNACFRSAWFNFDLTLVLVSVLSTWIVFPLMNAYSLSEGGPAFLQDASVIRTFRLLRIARSLRLLEQMKDFCRLTNGLLGSFRTVLSSTLVIGILLLLFGPLAVELITESELLLADPEAAAVVHKHFYNVWISMMTLVQFTSGDSMSDVYMPLIKVQPHLAIYFSVVWLSMTVAMMNIVGALLVLNAIEDAKTDADVEHADMRRQLKRLEPQIRETFASMDTNGDLQLDISELCSKLHVVKAANLSEELRDVIKPEKLVDLFEFLDVDNSGTVDEDEFLHGVSYLALSNVPVEVAQTLNLLKLVIRMLSDRGYGKTSSAGKEPFRTDIKEGTGL